MVLLEDEAGSPLRSEPPYLDDRPSIETSLVHAAANASKRSVILAPGDPLRGALFRAADVVVVSDRKTADEVAADADPGCIVIGVSPYGLDTSMAQVSGNDLTTSALSGWALTNALDGEAPLRPTRHQSSYVAGVMAYTGGIAALLARDASGEGQTVDISELEPMLWMAAPSILAETSGAPRNKPREHVNVFNGPVRANDGHITLTFSRPHFWTEAMRTLGLDELAEDPRYLNREIRQDKANGLAERIEAAVAVRARWELFTELADRRCTAGVVLDMADLASSEHLSERGVLGTIELDGQGITTIEAPCLMSETPWSIRRPVPHLGEHTEEVIQDWALSEAAR